MGRKWRFGMVGGGKDAFIGQVHRIAAQMDGQAELVCGAFSSTKQRSFESGAELGLPGERVYGTYREMMRKEAALSDELKPDFIAIVTPNNMHYPVSMAALEAGFHIVCDKPLSRSLDEAVNLEKKIRQCKRLFCLTHNYTGYPMVKQARAMVADGTIGRIRRVVVEYPQGWLAQRLETKGQKQATWRTDPKRAGGSCCMGDIGTHCANLAEYITGLHIDELCADLATFVKGRPLDDDGSVLLRFNNGARGVLWASQIAVGKENGLNIRIFGEKGGLEWRQEEPNTLLVHHLDRATEIFRTGTGIAGPEAAAVTRLPAGHPEGYLEAFANLYRSFYQALEAVGGEGKLKESDYDYPNIHDGVRGMRFLEAVVRANSAPEKWLKIDA